MEQEGAKISKSKVMKSGKAFGPDKITVEMWKSVRDMAEEFLSALFNKILENVRGMGNTFSGVHFQLYL